MNKLTFFTSMSYKYGRLPGPPSVNYTEHLMATVNSDNDGQVLLGAASADITTIRKGDAQSERIGQHAWITEIQLNIRAELTYGSGSASAFYPNKYRLALVLDTQCNGLQFTPGLVWVNSIDSTYAATVPNALGAYPMRNLDYSERFKILKYVDWSMSPQAAVYNGTTAESVPVIVNKTAYIKFKKPIQIEYTRISADGSISTRTTNSMSLVLLCDADTGSVSKISVFARTKFLDGTN